MSTSTCFSIFFQFVLESICNAGDPGLTPGLARSAGEGIGWPTPVFWPREFQGLYSPWSHKELDMTE